MNPHGSLHTPLKRARIPFRHYDKYDFTIKFSNFVCLRGGCSLKENPLEKRLSIVFLRHSATTTNTIFSIKFSNFVCLRGGCSLKGNPLGKRLSIVFLRHSATTTNTIYTTIITNKCKYYLPISIAFNAIDFVIFTNAKLASYARCAITASAISTIAFTFDALM